MVFCFVEVIKLPEFLQQQDDDELMITDAEIESWDWEYDREDVEPNIWR